jgi:creatinine amidohydrolase
MRLRDTLLAELQAAVGDGRPLFVPAGCVECHGNHLPLGTDTLIAEAVVERVAACVGGLVAPTIDFGPTGYAVSGPGQGTVDVPAEAFYPYAKGVLAGLRRLGFAQIFVVVHHQDLNGAEASSFHLAQAALFDELHRERGEGWWGERSDWPRQEITVLPTILPDVEDAVLGDHAGRTETSLIMHLRPELVDLERLKRGDHWYAWEPGRESASATSAEGEHLLSLMVDSVAGAVRDALASPR